MWFKIDHMSLIRRRRSFVSFKETRAHMSTSRLVMVDGEFENCSECLSQKLFTYDSHNENE